MAETRSLADNDQPYDAQEMAEDIAAGLQEQPEVDVSSDYEASKSFSESAGDRPEGRERADRSPAPMPRSEDKPLVTEPTGNPADYLEMAQEITPNPAPATVNDDLLEKALELGQPSPSNPQ